MLEAVGAGKAIVDCATLTPERMIVMSEAVTAKGGQFLEAPVGVLMKLVAIGTVAGVVDLMKKEHRIRSSLLCSTCEVYCCKWVGCGVQ